MMQFKRKNSYPPGGRFFYVVPETNTYFESVSGMLNLLAEVENHYNLNKLPVPENLRAKVEDYICRNVADGFCDGDDEGLARSLYRNITYWSMEKTSRDAVKRSLGEGESKWATVFEANNRASPCLTCTHNLRHICSTCNGLSSVVKGLTYGRQTFVNQYIGVCAMTGCFLAVMVFLKSGEYKIELERDKWPVNCWLRGGDKDPCQNKI